VRFVVPGDEGSSASSNDDDEEDEDGEENTEAKTPWKFSQLAKMTEALERDAFRTGSSRHGSDMPYLE
jgi:hypothetical protein